MIIIVKVTDGLGNQMFQYAYGKALSLEYGAKLYYDLSIYKDLDILLDEQKKGINRRLALHHFNVIINETIVHSHIKKLWLWLFTGIHKRIPLLSIITKYSVFDQMYQKLDYNHRPDVGSIKANKIYLIGYWQSEKYFYKYRNEISRDFQIVTPQSMKNKIWSDLIMNCNSVSLHVRRGDYPLEWLLDVGYYNRAIRYILKHVKNPVFFVFSDDIQWAKDNIKIPCEVHYMEQNNQAEAYEDLRLISQCKHNVIANSSFSWWGAWLNQNSNKIVIAPKTWIPGLKDSEVIILDEWIKL